MTISETIALLDFILLVFGTGFKAGKEYQKLCFKNRHKNNRPSSKK